MDGLVVLKKLLSDELPVLLVIINPVMIVSINLTTLNSVLCWNQPVVTSLLNIEYHWSQTLWQTAHESRLLSLLQPSLAVGFVEALLGVTEGEGNPPAVGGTFRALKE